MRCASLSVNSCSQLRNFACCVLVTVISAVLGTPAVSAQPTAKCPSPVPKAPPTTIAPQVPEDVCIPAGFAGNPIDFFDDYSWRSFIALIWPAKSGQRGQPDLLAKPGLPNRPLVFETYKAEWEVFQPLGKAPAPWPDYTGVNPCKLATVGFDDLILAAFSKFENLGQAGFGDLVGPIVAQNGTYVRFLTGFNEVEFKQILDEKLYLRENLKDKTLATAAIDIKAAWIDMAGIKHPDRYYTREAHVLDLITGSCVKKTVGLVGLHIVQKTPTRPQWIWSTFEHIDNVPPSQPGEALTFNAMNGQPMPKGNPYKFPPPEQAPPPYNVERVKGIHSQTEATNNRYRTTLRNLGSSWQFYQLVMTQWPLSVGDPTKDGRPNNTFPGVGAATSFANTVLETFDQEQINTGCMNCHNVTRKDTDFLWSLNTRAWPPIAAIVASQPPSPAVLATRRVPKDIFGGAVPPSVVLTMPPGQLNTMLELKALMETAHRN